jgi:hypothetical protein
MAATDRSLVADAPISKLGHVSAAALYRRHAHMRIEPLKNLTMQDQEACHEGVSYT